MDKHQDLPGYLPPEQRTCQCCGKTLKPKLDYEWSEVLPDGSRRSLQNPIAKGIRHYGYDKDGLFCTLGCAYLYAVAAWKHLNPHKTTRTGRSDVT